MAVDWSLKGSAGVSYSYLVVHAATLMDVLKMEHTMMVHVVNAS